MVNTLVYWYGIIGIPGKGPHYMETYEPNRTIGQIIQTMTANGLVEKISVLKYLNSNLEI